jgi:hypothetical protein
MGVTVQIGDNTLDLNDVTQSWLEDQISRRKRDHQAVCVVVTIKAAGADMKLASDPCGNRGPGGRPARDKEPEILKLWNDGHFSTGDFSAGHFYSFLQHLRRII